MFSRWIRNVVVSAGALPITMLMMASGPVWADGVEHLVWQGRPLEIKLAVGEERTVEFPGRVWTNIPRDLRYAVRGKPKLRTQIVANRIFWLANEPFARRRIEFRDEASGKIYLADLVAEKGIEVPDTAQVIDGTAPAANSEESAGGAAPAAGAPAAALSVPPEVALTRFAAQNVFGPQRLVEPLDGVVRVPVSRTRVDALYDGGELQLTPMASWSFHGLYVTVLKAVNQTGQTVVLDPRLMRGNWAALTAHHSLLYPKGSRNDRTVWYWVSHQRFTQTIRGTGVASNG